MGTVPQNQTDQVYEQKYSGHESAGLAVSPPKLPSQALAHYLPSFPQ